jgi:SAM-dependent methyltransferase
VIAVDVRAFARANLPPPPARVLEVGAGAGELARALATAGYEVLAIDPEPRGEGVAAAALHEVSEPPGSFDAAVAVLSLHHVEPLAESCRVLADLLRPGAWLLVDEFDVAAFDVRAAAWWVERRRALGEDAPWTAEQLVAEHREHLHPLADVCAALAPLFEVGAAVRGAYLYRWSLNESLRPAEEDAIARGLLPAVGARLLARRR